MYWGRLLQFKQCNFFTNYNIKRVSFSHDSIKGRVPINIFNRQWHDHSNKTHSTYSNKTHSSSFDFDVRFVNSFFIYVLFIINI